MKTIVISIARGSLVRNFFRSNVVSGLLNGGYRVVIATPQYDKKDIFEEFQHNKLHFVPLIPPKKIHFEGIIREFAKAVIFNPTVHARYRHRFSGKSPNMKLYIPRLLLSLIRYIPGMQVFIRWFDYMINPQYKHDYIMEYYKPSLVFITTTHEYADAGLIKSAKRFNIPTVSMPKSWDTISKITFLAKTDKLIVWNQFMKDQSLKYQGYKDMEIVVTGAPQFDYYQNSNNRQSREEFCEQLGLDSNKKIILYGSTGGNCFDEGAYVGLMSQWKDERKLNNVQILMRPHLGYHNDGDKFQKYVRDDVVLDTNDKQNKKFKDLWDTSENHLHHLYNSMYHADVCVNIASTLTLDATAAGTPVINVNFDIDSNINQEMSTNRLYTTDYINGIIKTKGSFFVESKETFLQALVDVLDRGKRAIHEETLVRFFIESRDGKASERINTVLISLIK